MGDPASGASDPTSGASDPAKGASDPASGANCSEQGAGSGGVTTQNKRGPRKEYPFEAR